MIVWEVSRYTSSYEMAGRAVNMLDLSYLAPRLTSSTQNTHWHRSHPSTVPSPNGWSLVLVSIRCAAVASRVGANKSSTRSQTYLQRCGPLEPPSRAHPVTPPLVLRRAGRERAFSHKDVFELDAVCICTSLRFSCFPLDLGGDLGCGPLRKCPDTLTEVAEEEASQ